MYAAKPIVKDVCWCACGAIKTPQNKTHADGRRRVINIQWRRELRCCSPNTLSRYYTQLRSRRRRRSPMPPFPIYYGIRRRGVGNNNNAVICPFHYRSTHTPTQSTPLSARQQPRTMLCTMYYSNPSYGPTYQTHRTHTATESRPGSPSGVNSILWADASQAGSRPNDSGSDVVWYGMNISTDSLRRHSRNTSEEVPKYLYFAMMMMLCSTYRPICRYGEL